MGVLECVGAEQIGGIGYHAVEVFVFHGFYAFVAFDLEELAEEDSCALAEVDEGCEAGYVLTDFEGELREVVDYADAQDFDVVADAVVQDIHLVDDVFGLFGAEC